VECVQPAAALLPQPAVESGLVRQQADEPRAAAGCRSPRESANASHDPIYQRLAFLKAAEVSEEAVDQHAGLLKLAAGGVRGDVAVFNGPQHVVIGQRFGVGDIEPGGGEVAGLKRGGEVVLVTVVPRPML
jgi:hypothetical protein